MVGLRKSEIWNYFDNVVEDGMAVCKTCQQRLRNNRSFNLRQHLRKVHNIDIEMQESCSFQARYSPQPYDEQQINAMLKVAKRKMQEDRHEKRIKKRIYIEMEKKTVVRSIMGLMIEDGVGPHLFDSKNMQSLLKPICDAISDQEGKEFRVNSNKTERSLSLVANNIRNDFSNDLHWRLLSLKIDTDVNASSRTFCVSAQFVNEGQVETRVLGIIDIEDEPHFSEKHVKEILHTFNIDSNQVVAACWDNTKERFKQQIQNSEYLKEIENFENYPDIYIGDIRVERYIGVIAQLCFLDIFKNSDIFQQFLQCRNLAKYLNDKSNGYYQIFEKNKLRIPQMDSPWKWGSSYTMIKDLLLARDILHNVKFEKTDSPEDHFALNEKLWSFIEAFSKVMNFLQKSILRFYGEEQHFGDFYAQWLKCKLLTEKLVCANKNQNNSIGLISSELLKSIEKRCKEFLGQHRFEACLYLDPRFHNTLNLQQKANALEYLKKLWSRAKIYNADVVKPSSEAESPMQFDDDEDAFLNDFLSQDFQVKDITTADVYARIERLKLPFQMVDTNILFFWRELKFSEPELHALSSICFAMPATQIYSKVRYSHIFTIVDSTKLIKFTKDNLLFIRLNAHLIDDAIDQIDIFKDDVSPILLAETQVEYDELIAPDKEVFVNDNSLVVTSTSPLPTTTTTNKDLSSDSILPINNIATLPISTIPLMPNATAIITPAGTAFLPPNITIKPLTTSN